MNVGLDRVLSVGSADDVFVLGETRMRRGREIRAGWLVCAIHRGAGEFTHLYRVPALPAGGRREVELLGVWAGPRLREASDRAAALLAVRGRVPAAEPTLLAFDEAA